ncbi:MAG: methyl-coenzyme M reductase operon protein D [Methanoregula sp.]|nr:methyl-coenzyme M reductase operon protein D [Methanoregula sp.]
MTDTTFPQCRIAGERLLNPDTVERLLNKICSICGVRRMIINGPRLSTAHEMSRVIKVGNQEIQLEVHVGTIILELENRDVIPALKAVCDEIFTKFSYRLQEGRFMKTEASLVDYAKYGPDADKDMLGLSDPKSRSGPVILQGSR